MACTQIVLRLAPVEVLGRVGAARARHERAPLRHARRRLALTRCTTCAKRPRGPSLGLCIMGCAVAPRARPSPLVWMLPPHRARDALTLYCLAAVDAGRSRSKRWRGTASSRAEPWRSPRRRWRGAPSPRAPLGPADLEAAALGWAQVAAAAAGLARSSAGPATCLLDWPCAVISTRRWSATRRAAGQAAIKHVATEADRLAMAPRDAARPASTPSRRTTGPSSRASCWRPARTRAAWRWPRRVARPRGIGGGTFAKGRLRRPRLRRGRRALRRRGGGSSRNAPDADVARAARRSPTSASRCPS